MSPSAIVQKLWNYCNVLRDDLSAWVHAQVGGLSYRLAHSAQASGGYPSTLLRTGPSTSVRTRSEPLVVPPLYVAHEVPGR